MKKWANMKSYNIMTSCDSNLLKYVFIQLYSMSVNLKNSIIHFYLLHRNISDEELQPLDKFCGKLGNIFFHAIRIPEPEKFDMLARHGGMWCGEAYYPICAHQVLPEHVKRVLYVDAGDVIFMEDISSFYDYDFKGKALIVTSGRYKVKENELVPYEAEDLYDRKEGFEGICRGLFNSGSYLINLDKLRKDQLTLDAYLDFSKALCEFSGKEDTSQVYWGDQGFISAAFLDDLMLYAYPQVRDIWNMPYNFCLWYYDAIKDIPPYSPAIVHFAGAPKPWTLNYAITVERFSSEKKISFRSLKIGQAEWYYVWHEYAIMTDRILKDLGY